MKRTVGKGEQFYINLKETLSFLSTENIAELSNFSKGCRLDLIHTIVLESKIKKMVGISHNFIVELLEIYTMITKIDETPLIKGGGSREISSIISDTVSDELVESDLSKQSPLLIDILIMLSLHDDLF
jgi:hypothetical protein